MEAQGKRSSWENRIVGQGSEAPDQLLANPANWRIHPKRQQDALAGILEEVGFVQPVLVNRTTGHLVDGHLRVSLALRDGIASIPVIYLDLSLAEEALVLATIDPLAGLAGTDSEQLAQLLEEVGTGSAAVQELLSELAANAGIIPGDFSALEGLPSDENQSVVQMTFTMTPEQRGIIQSAIAKAKAAGAEGESPNANGNALAAICEAYA